MLQPPFMNQEHFEDQKAKDDGTHQLNQNGSKENIKFHCGLCQKYLCCCAETECKHLFCEDCLKQYLLYSDECPDCYKRINEENIFNNAFMDDFIHQYISKFDRQELQCYERRVNQCIASKLQRRIDNLQVSMSVDVRDQNHIWCAAKVIKVIEKQDGSKNDRRRVVIQFDSSGVKETFAISSIRLAPFKRYSERKDIPHYSSNLVAIETKQTLAYLTDWDIEAHCRTVRRTT